jgi:hypothetical protein
LHSLQSAAAENAARRNAARKNAARTALLHAATLILLLLLQKRLRLLNNVFTLQYKKEATLLRRFFVSI